MGKRNEKDELAKLLGIEPPPPTSTIYESEDEISRQAEAALAYRRDSSYFFSKYCVSCGRLFAHTYGQVAYCSNPCRAKGLEKIGVKWEWVVNAEFRFGYLYSEPLVVPPEALEILLSLPDPTLQHPETPPEEPQPHAAPLSPEVFDILRDLGIE